MKWVCVALRAPDKKRRGGYLHILLHADVLAYFIF